MKPFRLTLLTAIPILFAVVAVLYLLSLSDNPLWGHIATVLIAIVMCWFLIAQIRAWIIQARQKKGGAR